VRRAVVILAASVSSALLAANPGSADRGVALDLGRLDIAQKLTPGGGYRLPPLGVRNPGDEVTSYRIVISHVEGQDGKPIPKAWVHVKPSELTLKPGRTEKVQARLDLPTGADPGDYEGLLAAQIVTKGKGAQVGAAAAAKLTFSVEASTWLGAQWYRIRTFLSGHEPWTWLIPALLATTLLGWQMRRRFAFQVVRRA
jgi:hypothetical protein